MIDSWRLSNNKIVATGGVGPPTNRVYERQNVTLKLP